MPDLDKTLMSLTHTLIHSARAYKAAADRVAGNFALSHASGWPVVMIARLGDGVRPGTVAEALGVEPPSLVRIIDQLVTAGLVTRQDDPADRRAKTLHLTAEGRHCAAQLEELLLPFRRELFAGLPQADIEACVRVLTHLDGLLAGRAKG
ncbi:MarR family transcriptional regulator [Pseudoduganella lutea]|uniref:MarR family transcriptional regulator n=2 Tax=Pseudoduganella lutea TaxID=321985 RepID=A0A4P6KSQ3_9BURK|nr:MarR family transcriptional regulator [Pseudoduganella lutea]